MASLALHGVARGHDVHVVYSPDRADSGLIDSLIRGGCASVRPSPMRRSIGPHDLVDGLALRRTIGAIGKVDVLHSHSSKAGALVRTACRFKGTAQIYSPHGFYTMTGDAPFFVGPVERALSLLTDRIIAVSEFEKAHALQIGIGSGRVNVVLNGVSPFIPLDREAARRELGLDQAAFVIGFVGRLAAQKDPLAAVETMAALPPEMPGTLVLIGDGDLKSDAQRRAAHLGDRVLFAGSRDAKTLMRAFDCLLCTSGYEGMPVSFLEALSCGVPIVTYPVGGSAELVRDKGTGFVTAASPDAAARAIERLATMPPTESQAMSDACKALAAMHSNVAMGDAMLKIYEDVLAGR
jgi:glycosyltransferase involved in cell wall biosynthesis